MYVQKHNGEQVAKFINIYTKFLKMESKKYCINSKQLIVKQGQDNSNIEIGMMFIK